MTLLPKNNRRATSLDLVKIYLSGQHEASRQTFTTASPGIDASCLKCFAQSLWQPDATFPP